MFECEYFKSASSFLKKITHLWPYVVLILILGFAFYIRSNTFWLPHWQGDQSQYVMLAAKWEQGGIKAYNLSGVDVRTMLVDVPFAQKKAQLVYPVYSANSEGTVAQSYKLFGISYYTKMPLYCKGPLFSIILSYSHRLLADPNQMYTIVLSNLGEWAGQIRPRAFIKAQFWAVIVPLAADLLVILLTFFFGRYLFGNCAGLYACFLMSIHPVNILSSNRLLLESPQLFFVLLSLFIFFYSFKKKSFLGIFISGVFGGLSVLTKQNSLLLVVVVWFYTVMALEKPSNQIKDWKNICVNKLWIFYTLGLFLVSYQWFLTVYQTYGNPFWSPNATELMKETIGWTRLLQKRPHPIILYPVGIPYMCPLFLLAYFSMKNLCFDVKELFIKKKSSSVIIFLWLWVFVFFCQLPLSAFHDIQRTSVFIDCLPCVGDAGWRTAFLF